MWWSSIATAALWRCNGCCSCALEQGARLAAAGEFTLRAFLNGRLDLTQAEGVADIVNAQSSRAAQTALAGLQGKLMQPIRDCGPPV
jgi:tRNA U34 5-carboxymethylaminomethyl modifying GTPase MnmE/TrmE